MSEEIPLRISFPKHGLDDVLHSFSADRKAGSILEFVISKYPSVQANSSIYVLNDQHKYSHVSPDEVLSDLDLKPQHSVLIIPETFVVDFIHMEGKTEKGHYSVEVSNESYVAEKLGFICLKNNLLDPMFYTVLSGNKELVQDESIVEQAPYAKSLTFRLLPTESIYDILIKDFTDSVLNCTLKDKQMIIMFILCVSFGAYKAAQRPQYDQKIKDSVPKKNKADASFVKAMVKSVIDIYKQTKPKANPQKECVDFIMGLPHFSSIVVNGLRGSVSKKRQVKPTKVTFSLNYSTLRVFKLDSASIIEQYSISKMIDPKIEDTSTLQFEYEIQGQVGRNTIKCRIDEKSDIFKIVVQRARSLIQRVGKGSAGSQAGAIFQSIQTPPFILGFNLFSDVPRLELNYTVIRASHIVASQLTPIIEEYIKAGETTFREPPKLFPTIKMSCNFISSYKPKLAIKLMKSFDDSRTLFSVLKLSNANQLALMANPQKKDKKAGDAAKAEFEQQKNDFKSAGAFFMKTHQEVISEIEKDMQQLPAFAVRPEFAHFLRSSIFLLLVYSWVNEFSPCRESIDKLKKNIIDLIRKASSLAAYTTDTKKTFHIVSSICHQSSDVSSLIDKLTANDKPIISDLNELSHKEIKGYEKDLKKYFKDIKSLTLAQPMISDIASKEPTDPREIYNSSKGLIESLSSKRIDDLTAAEADLTKLRTDFISLLEMSPKQMHEPLILAFNDLKVDVERNFCSYGANSMGPAAQRCQKTLHNVYRALNPAGELKKQLKSFSKSDTRVSPLTKIINYLSDNGPLYIGSQTHKDIQRFISQMPLGKTTTLLELAFTIESFVPEELRKLTSTCDPTKDLYTEVEQPMDVEDIVKNATKSAEKCAEEAIEARRILRKSEIEASVKYRTLNLSLWRTIAIFTQFAANESESSIGHRAFLKCRDAFKTLLEECSYDMRREKQFLPFIEEFTAKINQLIQSPHDSERLAALGSFLLMHQVRPGFNSAAKALSEFNHFVLVQDSNRAAEQLLSDATQTTTFRKASLMISMLRRRFITLLSKVDLALKTKLQYDTKRSDVDLRSDYHNFLVKYTNNLFIIFTQLVVARTTNIEAIQKLSTGCDAIEKLFPSVMNVEAPAPYLGRSVCGIVFFSMESLMDQCKKMGGKTQQCAEEAFLAVREFLFIIRRKIAESEKAKALLKTGIGIADMYAVVDRDNKIIKQQIEFQRSIRRRKW